MVRKNYRILQVFLVVYFLGITVCFAGEQKEAIAGVYAVMTDGRTSQGTGFFISPRGRLLTAYHVVVNAKQIRIVHQDKITNNVSVVRISPSHDLVELQVNFLSAEPLPYFEIRQQPFTGKAGQKIKIYAWPRGLPDFQLSGELIRDEFMNSHAVKDTGQRVFNSQIGLMMIGVKAYNGMSGAPVLLGDGVVGVFNGSIQEGGSIAWAIPISYTEMLTPHAIGPYNFGSWPPFTMILGQWNDLRNWYEYRPEIVSNYEKYVQLLSEVLIMRDELVAAYDNWLSLMNRENTLRTLHYDLWVDNRRLSKEQQSAVLEWWNKTKEASYRLSKTRVYADGIMNKTILLGNELLRSLREVETLQGKGYPLPISGPALALFYEDAAKCYQLMQPLHEQREAAKEAARTAQAEVKKNQRSSSARIAAVDELFKEFDLINKLSKDIHKRYLTEGGCWEKTKSALNIAGAIYEHTMFTEK